MESTPLVQHSINLILANKNKYEANTNYRKLYETPSAIACLICRTLEMS